MRCSVYIAASVDGYIARADGGLDWLEPVHVSGADYGYQAFFDTVDTLVIGRGTYDKVLTFPEWPYGDKRVVVMTHRPPAPRHDETFVAGAPADVLAGLGASTRAYIDGGVVIQQFLAAGLIDDLTISVIPIVLGAGIRLFPGGEGEHPLVLESTQAWPSGLVQLRYAVRR